MWFRRKPRPQPIAHAHIAEILRTTIRCRQLKLAQLGIDGDAIYGSAWLAYCTRKPFVEFATANEAITWVAKTIKEEESNAEYWASAGMEIA